MTDEKYWEIRKLLTAEGVWNFAQQMKVYTAEEFISEIGEQRFSDKLKKELRQNVGRMQCYLDDRILEAKKELQIFCIL